MRKWTLPLIPAAAAVLLSCGDRALDPDAGATFRIRPVYAWTTAGAAGLLRTGAVDQVRVMVLDASAYPSWNDFLSSGPGASFTTAKNGAFSATVAWADWRRFYGGRFPVVSDQVLEIRNGRASGTVNGVTGLNLIVTAFLENDTIRYSGETGALGGNGGSRDVEVVIDRWAAGTPGGTVTVRSTPPGASVYLDGANMNVVTPAVLRSVAAGHHAVRLYLAGYNETVVEFDLAFGRSLPVDAALTAPAHPLPVFTIAAPADSARFTDNVVRLSGTVELEEAAGGRSPFTGNHAVLTLNGVEREITVSSGSFDETLSIAAGGNRIRLRANSETGNTGESPEIVVFGDFTPPDIEITLTWNTPTSDLDLHVWNPAGEESYYYHKSISDGYLDIDDQEGFGPETFTSTDALAGAYTVKVYCYSLDRDAYADATVQLQIKGHPAVTHGPHHFDGPGTWWEVVRFNSGATKAGTPRDEQTVRSKIESDMRTERVK
jgi:uncharacterized protein YfaP (DUF2135 family)